MRVVGGLLQKEVVTHCGGNGEFLARGAVPISTTSGSHPTHLSVAFNLDQEAVVTILF